MWWSIEIWLIVVVDDDGGDDDYYYDDGDDENDDNGVGVDVFVIDICDRMLRIFYVHKWNHVGVGNDYYCCGCDDDDDGYDDVDDWEIVH